MAEQQGGNRKRMKKLIVFFGLVLWVCGLTGGANASSIYDIVDWSDRTKRGRTATKMNAKNGPVTFIHNVFLDGDASVTDLTLTISHRGNRPNRNRAWSVSDSTGNILGLLENSKRGWVDQVFSLSPELYEDMINGSLSIEFTLDKGARKKGALWLDSSIVSGNYDLAPAKIIGVDAVATPIPSSMLLLGTGLAGLVWGRKKFKRG